MHIREWQPHLARPCRSISTPDTRICSPGSPGLSLPTRPPQVSAFLPPNLCLLSSTHRSTTAKSPLRPWTNAPSGAAVHSILPAEYPTSTNGRDLPRPNDLAASQVCLESRLECPLIPRLIYVENRHESPSVSKEFACVDANAYWLVVRSSHVSIYTCMPPSTSTMKGTPHVSKR